MAENAPSAIVVENEDSKGTSGSVRILAPPKFTLRQDMSGKVTNTFPDDDGSVTEIKDADLNSSGSAVKRSAEREENDEESEPDEAACSSPVKKVAKLDNTSTQETEDVKPPKLIFKPSILSDVAKNLTSSSAKIDRNSTASPVPKTLGVSSSENSVAELNTDASQRSHESAPPEQLAGIIGASSKNYFEQFLFGSKESSTKPSGGSFVFGQNMSDRVMFSTDSATEDGGSLEKSDSENTADANSSSKDHKTGDELKTLADVAHSYADAPGPSSPNQDKPHKSLAEAAMAYQEHLSPPKSQPARVSVVTGEEEERNVLQSNCRLFVFDTITHSWREKGRGILRLNDMCQSMTEGIFQSRLVMRTQGSLRVVLNTKLWPSMTLEKGNEKSLRITAMDTDKDIKIYLIMAAPNDIQRLWTAIDRRIQALKRGQNTQANEESSVQGPSADDEEETRTEPDDELKSTGHEDDDEPAKDRCEVVDKSNNDSCPTGEGRGKETVANDD